MESSASDPHLPECPRRKPLDVLESLFGEKDARSKEVWSFSLREVVLPERAEEHTASCDTGIDLGCRILAVGTADIPV